MGRLARRERFALRRAGANTPGRRKKSCCVPESGCRAAIRRRTWNSTQPSGRLYRNLRRKTSIQLWTFGETHADRPRWHPLQHLAFRRPRFVRIRARSTRWSRRRERTAGATIARRRAALHVRRGAAVSGRDAGRGKKLDVPEIMGGTRGAPQGAGEKIGRAAWRERAGEEGR